MTQSNIAVEDDAQQDSTEDVRERMRTTHGHERRTMDAAGDDHALSGMDSERQAPIESVAKNVVRRYDQKKAAIREYMANSHTACIQRAKHLLIDNDATDGVDMSSVRAVLDEASEQFGYEPVIEVSYNRNPEARWTLRVEDNGIGIDSDTAYAIRDIGLSGWHMDGSTNGQFGQGTMSGFLLSGMYGEFHMLTKSAITGENYRAAWKLTDLNKIRGKRDAIGTSFIWPTLCDEATDINVHDAVREYAEGMIVPVIFEDYDSSGNETGRSDEFLPSYMESRYPDEAMVITYEDEFGKVVWSPQDPEGWNTNLNTFCGYQPIDRNTRGFGFNKYNMPSGFDFRLKVEDGSIIEVDGSMDHELVGKTPVSNQKYQSMLVSERDCVPTDYVDDDKVGFVDTERGGLHTTDKSVASKLSDVSVTEMVPDCLERAVIDGKQKGKRVVSESEWESMDDGRIGDDFVPRSQIDDSVDVIQSMEPTDDRDRFERKHVDEVLSRYTDCLYNRLRERTASVFESVDNFEDVFCLDGNDQALFHKGVDRFGPSYSRSDPATVQDQIESELSVSLPLSVCEKIDVMKKKVSVAPRGCSRPQKMQNREQKPVWKVMRMANDGDKNGDVYMGFRITERKARLVWELDDDNVVVQTTKRDLFSERLGWNDMRDLPTSNFSQHFDSDFDDDFVDTWDKSLSDDSGTSTSGSLSTDVRKMSLDDERAKKRDVTLRTGTGHGAYLTDVNTEVLFDGLDSDDESVSAGSYPLDTLILYRETEQESKGEGSEYVDKHNGVFYAHVPNYVYDYLIRAENVVTPDEYEQRVRETWIDYDWSKGPRAGRTIDDLDGRDAVLLCTPEDFDAIREYDAMDEFRSVLTDKMQAYDMIDDGESVRSITYMRNLDDFCPTDMHDNYNVDVGEHPTIVSISFSGNSHIKTAFFIDVDTVFYDSVLPDLDRGAPEWNTFNADSDDETFVETMRRLQDAGGFVSTDDYPDVPFHDGDGLTIETDRVGGYDCQVSLQEMYVTKTLERLGDAGGFVTEDDLPLDGGDN